MKKDYNPIFWLIEGFKIITLFNVALFCLDILFIINPDNKIVYGMIGIQLIIFIISIIAIIGWKK